MSRAESMINHLLMQFSQATNMHIFLNALGAELDELTKALEDFLKKQSKEKRRIFLLRYWYSFSIGEIAKELSQSESKVTSTLFRLRLKLKDYLEKEGILI